MHRTNTAPDCNPSSAPGPACLDAALSYLSRGWCPLPLCPPNCCGNLSARHKHPTSRSGKVPLVPGWTQWKELPSAGEVRSWWERWPDANVGIALGAISHLIGVDVDGTEGNVELLRVSGGGGLDTLRFNTPGGGYRLLYSWTEKGRSRSRHIGGKGRPLSVLADGAQTVMPPSRGNNGGPYDWTDDGATDRGCLPPPAWLLEIAGGKATPKRPTVVGPIVRPMPIGRDDGSVRRARAYLAKCPPAVEGEGGDARTYKVTCKLVGLLGLDSDTALSLLREWNAACVPPWSEEELARKVALAVDRHTEEGPTLRLHPIVGGVRDMTSADTGASSRKAAAYHGDQRAGEPAEAAESDDQEQLPGALISEYQARPLEWFDRPYVARSQVSALVGRPGTGKSTYLAHLVSRSKHTLYLPGEEDVSRMLLPRLKASGAQGDQVRVIPPDDRWVMPYARDSLLKTIRQTGADLVVFDPVDDYLADSVDENANVAVRQVLQSLREVAEMSGAAVVMCRHVGKATDNVMPGSRAWYAHPRTIVEMLADRDTPPKRIVRLHKDSLGQNPPARYFDLVREGTAPPRFALGGEVAPEVVELVAAVSDPMDRKAVDQACDLVRRLLADGRMEASAAFKHAEGERLNERTMRRAAEQLRVVKTREGNGKEHRCYWELPK